MKILLTTLNSKYIHSNLALRYLYTSCCNAGIEDIELREFTINNTDEQIFIELMRTDYDIIAFSCYIWNIEKTLRIVRQLKSARLDSYDRHISGHQSNLPAIILGGPEVSFDSAELMQENDFIDFVISGEGENSLPSLISEITHEGLAPSNSRCFRTMRDFLYKTAGVTFRYDGEIRQNMAAEPPSFESAPFPYTYMKPESDKVVYYESSRGCPFRCAYCLSSVMKNVRPLPLDRVKRELDFFLQEGVRQVKFIDRTFNYDRKRCCSIVSYILENDNDITNFHFELCGDLIDDEFLKLLKSARKGLFQFEIGVQSTNKEALHACNRNTEFQNMARQTAEILQMGTIHVHLDLIAGLPYETYETFRKSFNDVFSLRPDALQIGFLKLLKGSPVRLQAADYGYVFRSTPPYEVISNDFMSASELVRIKMIDTVFDLWYNRGGFTETLEYLFEKSDAFDVFEALAEFYYNSGFQNRNHKKEDLYRILLLFAQNDEEVRKKLETDMQHTLNFDAVKKFIKKGWGIS